MKMKLRHAATLTLIGLGWYLMVPPDVHKGSASVKTLEPMGQWLNLHSFDTAAACENGLADATKGIKDDLSKNPTSVAALRKFRWISDAECIASDDPRLKEK